MKFNKFISPLAIIIIVLLFTNIFNNIEKFQYEHCGSCEEHCDKLEHPILGWSITVGVLGGIFIIVLLLKLAEHYRLF